jgi:hypothetical protein
MFSQPSSITRSNSSASSGESAPAVRFGKPNAVLADIAGRFLGIPEDRHIFSVQEYAHSCGRALISPPLTLPGLRTVGDSVPSPTRGMAGGLTLQGAGQ